LLRLEFEREGALQAHQAAVAAMAGVEAEAKDLAAVALSVAYGTAVDELARQLEGAAAANRRMAELHQLAAGQFPTTASAGGYPAAGCDSLL
jgi:hypothetical protein